MAKGSVDLGNARPEVADIQALLKASSDMAVLNKVMQLKGTLDPETLMEVYRAVVDHFITVPDIVRLSSAVFFAEELQALGDQEGAILRERALYNLEQLGREQPATANLRNRGSDFFYARTRRQLEQLDSLSHGGPMVEDMSLDSLSLHGCYSTRRRGTSFESDPSYHLQVFSSGQFGPKYHNDAPQGQKVNGYLDARASQCRSILFSGGNAVAPPFLINGEPVPSLEIRGGQAEGQGGKFLKKLGEVLRKSGPFKPVTFEISDVAVHLLGPFLRKSGLFDTVDCFFHEDIPGALWRNMGIHSRTGYFYVDIPRSGDSSLATKFQTTFSLVPNVSAQGRD